MGEPYLIPPCRRDYQHEPGDMEQERARRAHYPTEWERGPEWIPLVCCIGCFRSFLPVNDPEKHGSCLTVVWYQDDYALPIAAEILQSLKRLDWDSLAIDFEY